MSKIKKQYCCQNCGSLTGKWSGQCIDCQSWGSVQEEIVHLPLASTRLGSSQNFDDLASEVLATIRTNTGIDELDRVLGGGLVAGSAILIGGDPGIGKSTLLLQLASSLSSSGLGCLYVTGEESSQQIKLRATRLGISRQHAKINILAATNIEDIIATIQAHQAQINFVIIDSIQTMSTNEISATPGTVSQIRCCAQQLISYAKHQSIMLLMACHVTKDGQLAGPKILEHMVDTVLYFEGDHNNHFRILRSIKNRFGSINEIGVFEMTSTGLRSVNNPSELFLMQRENNVSGTAVFAGIEGSRPLLTEVQALITPSNMTIPRRSVVGWDSNRLSMIIAVLSVRFGLNLSAYEVYLSVAGGLKITEPAADLAVAAALISAFSNKATINQSIFFGEIGLSGEVRKVTQGEARVKEALKLGFNRIICAGLESLKQDSIQPINHIKQLKGLI